MPTTLPPRAPRVVLPRLTRKTLLLLTDAGSIGPVKGMEMRGWRLKPSSVLSTSMSAQSLGNVAQFGLGRLTRTPVRWVRSRTVNTSLGNGRPDGDEPSKRTRTPAASAAEGSSTSRANGRGSKRRNDVIGVSSRAGVGPLARSPSKSAEGKAPLAGRGPTTVTGGEG